MSTSSGRTWFDHRVGRHRPKHFRNGLIFAVFTVIFLYVIYTRPSVPFIPKGGTEVTAHFSNGINIRPGYTPVRVGGVDVGQVTDVKRASSGRGVDVEFRVEDGKGVDVKRDASVALRWRTLLGRNIYLDLEPGSRSAPALGGQTIPLRRTGTQVELDDTLEPLDDNGRTALKTMMREFNAGFSDPAAARDAIRALDPAMRRIGPGLAGLRGTELGDLTKLVGSTSRMMGALSRSEVALGRLVSDGRTALAVTAARSADLGATVRQAPAAMRQTRSTMVRLRQTLDTLDPVADELRPGARQLASAAPDAERMLAAAKPLLADARPTLDDLRPAVSRLREASASGVKVIDGLDPVLVRAQDRYIPWLNERDDSSKLKHYETVGPAISGASSGLSWGDAHGAVGNFFAGVGEGALVTSPCNLRVTDPKAKPEDKIKCEMLTRAIPALLNGTTPDKVEVRGSTVSEKVLKPLLEPLRRAITKGGDR